MCMKQADPIQAARSCGELPAGAATRFDTYAGRPRSIHRLARPALSKQAEDSEACGSCWNVAL